LGLTFVVKVGKKRVITIPKAIADELGIYEGCRVKMFIEGNKLVIEPIRDAIWLSIHGEKLAKITLRELESTSIEEQEKYVGKQ